MILLLLGIGCGDTGRCYLCDGSVANQDRYPHDVGKLTTMPILGEIPLQKEMDATVPLWYVKREQHDGGNLPQPAHQPAIHAEQRRPQSYSVYLHQSGRRQNLYSVNLAVSLALLGKK